MSSQEVDSKCSPNICCIGTNIVGVATCVVIAHKCPEINVVVTDVEPERIYFWNSKKVPAREPGLDDLLKKCQNKNLIFTTDNLNAIQEADVIFVSVSIPLEKREGEDTPNVTALEKAARFIASTATKNKIIVEKSNVPVGTSEILKSIISANRNKKIKFEILSNPEFYVSGSAIQNLLFPERVIIGSDTTKRGITAAKFLASIYCQWVPKQKIITMRTWSSEITKLSLHAMLNQKLSSVTSISMICEEIGGDIKNVVSALGKPILGCQPIEPFLGSGDGSLLKELKCLIYMCEKRNLKEVADYWKEVLQIHYLQQHRFLYNILRSFFLMLKNKKIAVWGFCYKGDVEQATTASITYICRGLLREGAKLSIYDPILGKKQIMEQLKLSGEESLSRNVTLAEDPMRAANKANAIICSEYWELYEKLDYVNIHKDMIKPAFVFDGGNYLPHQQLISIGFIVKSVGKAFNDESKQICTWFEPLINGKQILH